MENQAHKEQEILELQEVLDKLRTLQQKIQALEQEMAKLKERTRWMKSY
jgi:prefoldin subunit 5